MKKIIIKRGLRAGKTTIARSAEGKFSDWKLDKDNPGIIRFNDDPLSGILAGSKAAEIVKAVNNHRKLLGALKLALESRKIDGDRAAISALITAGRAAVKAAEEGI